jgi:hypothetical protein
MGLYGRTPVQTAMQLFLGRHRRQGFLQGPHPQVELMGGLLRPGGLLLLVGSQKRARLIVGSLGTGPRLIQLLRQALQVRAALPIRLPLLLETIHRRRRLLLLAP